MIGKDSRVLIKPLGTYGTVVRVRPDRRITAIGDGATQAAVWLPSEIEELNEHAENRAAEPG